jgi:hypothetical protein
MSKKKRLQQSVLTESLETHLSTVAWCNVSGSARVPHKIDIFKGREQKTSGKKSFIYRLHGAGDDGGMIIAKKCRSYSAETERLMYTKILPSLGFRHLRFYGTLESPSDGMTWLFLEDAGENLFSRETAEHRDVAAHWLARIHLMTSGRRSEWNLPRRDVAYYSAMSTEAREMISRVRNAPGFFSEHHAIMDEAVRLLDVLDTRWSALDAACSTLPETLVHADLVEKNIRLQVGADGLMALLVFDWEMAGWGSPAADLATTSVGLYEESATMYWSVVRDAWPQVTRADIHEATRAGMILRTAAEMQWGCYSLHPSYLDRPFRRMMQYNKSLTEQLRAS